ncbi:uncharacterized protein PF3D7_1120600-like [Leptopilina boulardi]|uniref:uncharacterized protein PF3D7_1120600-like n=1 Tax=Leptopilina boulardi TaxID=63433 RepID=UPI0021F5171C|nr:uncharacterized protein PF3D7_1120600-like [Leptopilina boulardi]XP_051158924.1 uncharacterized protein PF3D7_1120600-like [Leptopilina boulardi]
MDEEIDIYADIPSFNENDSHKCKQCVKLETQLNELTNKFKGLEKCSKILEDNYSSLLLTAKGEITRKERMIDDLRQQLNDRTFRRGKYRQDTQISKSKFTNESQVHVPIPPPEIIKNIEPQNAIVDVSEYICNSAPNIKDDDDVEQKYEPNKIFNTVYSQRLRKKLQDEDNKKKILENQESENEKKIEENMERKEELENIKSPVPDNLKELNVKCNIHNKENVSSSNQLQSSTLNSQSTITSSLNEENSIKNKTIFTNKSSTKRSHDDNDEIISNKRIKTEIVYEHYRENWGIDNETESIEKQNHKSETYNYNTNFGKFNEINDEKYSKKMENSSHDSRLNQISEQSISTFLQEKRRDVEKRENYDRGRHEHDKYRNKYDSERYYDNDRDHRDVIKHKKYERDYYRHEKYDKRRYDDKYENTRYERERNDKYSKRTRRSESLSPERNYSRYKDNLRGDNFGQRQKEKFNENQKNKNEDWRDKFDRPCDTDVKLTMNDFNSRRQQWRNNSNNCSARSKSCGSGRDRRDNIYNSERSRSRGKELKITDPNKKISLENYRARRDQRSDSSEKKINRKSSEKEQKLKENSTRNRRSSTDKISKKDEFIESKIISNEKNQTILVKKNTKLSNIPEESINKKLEDGEHSKNKNTLKLSVISNLEEKGKIEKKEITKIEINNKTKDSENSNKEILLTDNLPNEIKEKNNENKLTNSNPKLVQAILGEILNNTIERHVQSLDSFIESAERILEENKEGYNSAKEISKEMTNELRDEINGTIEKNNTNKIENIDKQLEKISPIKKNQVSTEVEGKISNTMKQNKKCETIKLKVTTKNEKTDPGIKENQEIILKPTISSLKEEKQGKIVDNSKCKILSPKKENREKSTENLKCRILAPNEQNPKKFIENSEPKITSTKEENKEQITESKLKISNTKEENQGKIAENSKLKITNKENREKITENSKPKVSSSKEENKTTENLKPKVSSSKQENQEKINENAKPKVFSSKEENKTTENLKPKVSSSKQENQEKINENVKCKISNPENENREKIKENLKSKISNTKKENGEEIIENSKSKISNPKEENKNIENSKSKISNSKKENHEKIIKDSKSKIPRPNEENGEKITVHLKHKNSNLKEENKNTENSKPKISNPKEGNQEKIIPNSKEENQLKVIENLKPKISNSKEENKNAEISKLKISNSKEETKNIEKGVKITETKIVCSENKILKPLDECCVDVKKVSISSTIKVQNLPKQVESNSIQMGNISSAVKERRKIMKEQKTIEAQQKINDQLLLLKSKEVKKPISKIKQETTDIKSKTKKIDDKLKKKKLVIVKRRTRPVILTDSNASTTIVSKENMIVNIKLNTSGEKNNLLS